MCRKILNLLLIGILCGSLTACGSAIESTIINPPETSLTDPPVLSETPTETLPPETTFSSTDTSQTTDDISSETTPEFTESSESESITDTISSVNSNNLSSYTDEQLLLEANSLFTTASEMCWNAMLGRLFTLDESNLQEFPDPSGFPAYCYKVTQDGISSISDAENYWHRFFSARYDDMYSEYLSIYREENGELWSRTGERGSNIFYDYTLLSEITEKSDDEVTFKAISYYSDPDTGLDQYTEEHEFSIVFNDGDWLIGKFTLPY